MIPAGREFVRLLALQSGPHAARVFVARPTSPELSLDSPVFRALLLRRLRMPLPLVAARCRCNADDRRIEVIANRLPLNGAQVAVDTTLVSALTSRAEPGRTVGAALLVAAVPLLPPHRARHRSWGRWGAEAASLVRQLARCRVRAAPPASRAACTSAFALR